VLNRQQPLSLCICSMFLLCGTPKPPALHDDGPQVHPTEGQQQCSAVSIRPQLSCDDPAHDAGCLMQQLPCCPCVWYPHACCCPALPACLLLSGDSHLLLLTSTGSVWALRSEPIRSTGRGPPVPRDGAAGITDMKLNPRPWAAGVTDLKLNPGPWASTATDWASTPARVRWHCSSSSSSSSLVQWSPSPFWAVAAALEGQGAGSCRVRST